MGQGESKRGQRIDLLVASVSADPVVLAKLVHTLKPGLVLVFSTPMAEQRGWEANARAVLEHCRGLVIEGYSIERLTGSGPQEQHREWTEKIKQALRAAVWIERVAAFDSSTGRGLFRVLGYEVLRREAAEFGAAVLLVFCSGDSGEVIIADCSQQEMLLRSRPICFQYRYPENPLAERLAIHGVHVRGGKCLWAAGRRQFGNDKDVELVLRLFDESLNYWPLRSFVRSHYDVLSTLWRQQSAGKQFPAEYIAEEVSRGITSVAETIARLTGCPDDAGRLASELREDLKPFLPAGNTLVDWQSWAERGVASFFQQLSRSAVHRWHLFCDEFAREAGKPGKRGGQLKSVQIGAPNKKESGMLSTDKGQRAISRSIKQARYAVEKRVNEIKASLPNSELEFSKEQYLRLAECWFAEQSYSWDKARDFLERGKLADTFEYAIALAVVREIEGYGGLRNAVAAVYTNVELVRDARLVCELDTLVLLCTGDLLVLEAKTHFGNADLKQLQANIKQLRDSGGAYSKYALVFPLTRTELADLSEGRDVEDLGASSGGWGPHLRNLAAGTDVEVVGMDEVRLWLRKAIEAVTGGV